MININYSIIMEETSQKSYPYRPTNISLTLNIILDRIYLIPFIYKASEPNEYHLIDKYIVWLIFRINYHKYGKEWTKPFHCCYLSEWEKRTGITISWTEWELIPQYSVTDFDTRRRKDKLIDPKHESALKIKLNFLCFRFSRYIKRKI